MELHRMDLVVHCASNESSIRFLQVKGTLKNQTPCPTCLAPMTLVKDASKQLDEFRWRCRIHLNDKISVRDDSWLTFQQFIMTAYFWSVGIQNHQITPLLNLSQPTVVKSFQYFLELCSHWLLENPILLGGVGYTLQLTKVCSPSEKTTEDVFYHNGGFLGILTLRKSWGFYERYQIGR